LETTLNGTSNYLNNTTLSGNTTNGFTILYPDGSQDIYGFVVTNSSGDFMDAYLTQRITANSQTTALNYNSYVAAQFPVIRLESIVDGSGGTNLISYSTNNGYSTNLIIKVTDAFGRAATMNYSGTGDLTNITDVSGLSSSLTYDTNDWPLTLTTPYGTTSFDITDTTDSEMPPNGRSIVITQPDGSVQIYLCTNSAAGVPSSLSGSSVPNTSPFTNTFDTTDLNLYDTFWWGPKQYTDLSTTNIGSFTAADFRKARMKHWLQFATNWIGPTLSMQIDPSPDAAGSVNGEITWYDYAGKTDTEFQGTQVSPLFVARVLPDGTTSFTRTDRNSSGALVTNVSTYTAGSSVALRTNIFTYAANQTDMLTETNAMGIQVVSNTYNAYHEVVLSYDALNEPTVYTYDTNQRQTSVISPTGLVTTNVYGSDGYLAEQAEIGIATNSYTYVDGLVSTQTSPLGMTVANTWDYLQRPTSCTYPDGTLTSNQYTYLDMTATKDRLGNWTRYGYDHLRRNIAVTNALGNYTLYDYCLCGALETTRDALGNYTTNNYDNQVRLTGVDYPDGYSITYNLNLIGQTTNTIDSSGLSVTNWFNNQGLQFASSNAFGQVANQSFDILDRVTNTVDQNGVVVVTTYDSLNRALTRTYPDSGVERYGYSAAGLIAYTNQLANITYYGYDPARRKIAETNALGNVTEYAYDEASDLTTLTDQNNNTTRWRYDIYGRATNKVDATSTTILEYQYDADNRLTNRWSIARGSTKYAYDAVGNLTSVTYPLSPSLSFLYDALNRMTSMADGIGTTSFTYTQVGQLASETGPWASDAVSYTYANRLRSSLALQQPYASAWAHSYSYDAANRLNSITSPAGTFTYSYNPGTGGVSAASTLISLMTLPNGAFITNTYDSNGRGLGTYLYNSSAGALDSSVYSYNVGNQRTTVTRSGENAASYTYDPIGQVIADQASEVTGGASRLNEQLHYAFDPAGNLAYRTNNSLVANFRVNSVNELTTNTNGGTLTVMGTTTSPATSVSVNGIAASMYGDSTFAATGLACLASVENGLFRNLG
jgi:YD repeat-containing protein